MKTKQKSLLTIGCVSLALLGASLGVTKPVKAYGYGYGYGYGYPYHYYLTKGYEDGLREGSKLFSSNSSKNDYSNYYYNPYGYEYGYGYKIGHSEGEVRTRMNYPFLSLISDGWKWVESFF